MARKQREERQITTQIVHADRGPAHTGLANHLTGEREKERKEKEAKEKQKRKNSTTRTRAKLRQPQH